MNRTDEFDRVIASWLETSGPADVHEAVVESALWTARRRQQRRGLAARLAGPAPWPATRWWPEVAPAAGALRIAIAAALLLAFVAAAAAGALLLTGDQAASGLVFALDDGLYLANPDGSDRRRIRDDGWFWEPRWSPSGRYIAAMHFNPGEANELLILHPDGTVAGRFTCCGDTRRPDGGGPPWKEVTDFAWVRSDSADGEALLVSSMGAPSIDPEWVVDTAGTRLLERREDGGWDSLDPRSSELRPLVYVGTQGSARDLFVLEPGAGGDGTRRMIVDLGPPREPGTFRGPTEVALSPDGSTVALLHDCGDRTCELSVVPVNGGTPTLLATNVYGHNAPSWSPDGRSVLAILWEDGPRLASLVAVDGSGRAPILDAPVPGSIINAPYARWSADGSRILVFNGRTTHVLRPGDLEATAVLVRAHGADLRP